MENELKQRNGCISFWLWIAIIVNMAMVIYYAVTMFSAYSSEAALGFGLCSIFGAVNVLSAILLLRWNKIGFYMMVVSSIMAIVVNICVLKMEPIAMIGSLFAIVIWWAILQMKKNGVSAWSQLQSGWDGKHCRHLYQLFAAISAVLFILTMIAFGHAGSSSNDNSDDIVAIADDEVMSEEEVVEVIGWETFISKNGECSIEAPDDMRKNPTEDEQVLMLMCTDYDPVCVVVAEPISDVKAIGINNTKQYAEVVMKSVQKSDEASGFKKIGGKAFGTNSYLITYDVLIEGTPFRYFLLAAKGDTNYYNCTIFCVKEYLPKLESTIDMMLESFKALK